MLLLLLGCATHPLEGAAAKGPFVLGSTVSVSALDEEGDPTGELWSTETTSDLGAFSLDGVSGGPLRLEVVGYHYDEVRGELSGSTLTLRAYGEPDESGALYVNTVTHLASRRVIALVSDGASMEEATAQAEGELQVALGIGPAGFDPGASGVEMNLLGGDTDANAWLLAVSAVMAQAALDEAAETGSVDAGLQELLNRTASDLEDDGALETEHSAVIAAAEQEISSTEVEANLAARFAALGFGGAVPDLARAMDRDGDGSSDAEDEDADGDGEPSVDAGGNDCEDEDASVLGCGPEGEITQGEATAQTLEGSADQDYFGQPLSALGDLDADGAVDFALGWDEELRLYTAGGAETPAVLAATLAGAWRYAAPVGDTDGDGVDELAVGRVATEDLAGEVLVTPYPLGSGVAEELEGSWIYGIQPNDRMGQPAGLGDVDGDGRDDLAVVEANGDASCDDCGAVLVFGGPLAEAPTPDDALAGVVPEDADAAYTVGSPGDLDGDGLADLVVSDTNYTHNEEFAGAAFVFQGGLSSVVTPEDADLALIGSGSGKTARLFLADDLDGDGHQDLVVQAGSGCVGSTGDPWIAWFRGPFTETESMGDSSPDGKLVLSPYAAMEVNASAGPVDADGDGTGDLWVGARFDHTGSDAGRAYLYLMPFYGTRDVADADASIAGESAGQYLGQRLAAPGDLDGDGWGELLVWSQPAGVPQVDVVLGGGW